MRKLLHLALALSLLIPGTALAQNVAAPIFSGAGAPTGACLPAATYYDTNSGLIWTCVGTAWQLPAKTMLLSTYTVSNSTMTNMTGLSFPVGANQNYGVICSLIYQVSSTSSVPQIQFTGPASPTNVFYSALWQLSIGGTAPAYTGAVSSAFNTIDGEAPTVAATNMQLLLHFSLRNGVNAGTVQLQGAVQVTGTFTVQPGSWCAVQ